MACSPPRQPSAGAAGGPPVRTARNFPRRALPAQGPPEDMFCTIALFFVIDVFIPNMPLAYFSSTGKTKSTDKKGGQPEGYVLEYLAAEKTWSNYSVPLTAEINLAQISAMGEIFRLPKRLVGGKPSSATGRSRFHTRFRRWRLKLDSV